MLAYREQMKADIQAGRVDPEEAQLQLAMEISKRTAEMEAAL